MKLIIDIDEEYYKIVKSDVEKGMDYIPCKLIANGTPLQTELEEIKAKIIKSTNDIMQILDKHINQADCDNDCEHCEWTECPKE